MSFIGFVKLTKKLRLFLKENRGFITFLFLMVGFRTAYADWSTVPTSSMLPTIVEGDRIAVNKLAYDFRLPFVGSSIYRHSDPERGDIVVFDSKVADLRLVKRVIGVPDDIISLDNHQLSINRQKVQYSPISRQALSRDLIEELPNLSHQVRIHNAPSQYSSFSEVVVPKGYYLVLGDNRDNSADSRVIGLVPREEIIGRAKYVIMSLDYENYYLPRKERFFHKLDS